VAAVYAPLLLGVEPQLPELPIQFLDFASWERRHFDETLQQREIQYWRKRLEGFAPVRLPTDRPRGSIADARSATEWFEFGPQIRRLVIDSCRREAITESVFLLAAFLLLLSRRSGQKDVTISVPFANRARSELQPLIGMFQRTLLVRVNIAGADDSRELLRRVRDSLADSFAHQEFPIEVISERLCSLLGIQSLPKSVMFTFASPPSLPSLPGLEVGRVRVEARRARDLTFLIGPGGHGLEGMAIYNSAIFDRQSLLELIDEYGGLLRRFALDLAEPSPSGSSVPISPMKLRDFVEHLRDLDVKLSLAGGALRVDAPTGRVTPELRRQLAARKPELLELLRNAARPSSARSSRA
jgi:non-ribosomal peptide synthetase component F